MKDELRKAKSELMDALRKVENTAPKAQVKALEKIIGDIERLQSKVS